MGGYGVSDVRNVAIVGHGGSGKTSLVEAILYSAGVTSRLGRVDEGNTVSDFDPEEIQRKVSINSSVIYLDYNGKRINIVDTPGYGDFISDMYSAVRVVDTVVMVISAPSGIEVQTEVAWDRIQELEKPAAVVVNKLDREHTDFYNVLEELRSSWGKHIYPLFLPVGKEAAFNGLIDLIGRKAYVYKDDLSGKYEEKDIPSDMEGTVDEWREKIVEAVAEADDELLNKYLEGEELSENEILDALKKAIADRVIIPVVPASAYNNVGCLHVLEMIEKCLPSPVDIGAVKGVHPETKEEVERKPDESEPFSALVFKVMVDPYVGKLSFFRVYSGKIKADDVILNVSKGETEKMTNLFVTRGKEQSKVTELKAGDIAAVAKIKSISIGDTLSDKDNPILFEPIKLPSPIYSVAVFPKSKGDEDKLNASLEKLTEEDPTFRAEYNVETKETIVSGMGDLHLGIMMERLKRRFGVDVDTATPKVPYKESIKGRAKAQGKYKKQTGGHGQYGDVWIEFEPLERGKGFEFTDKIVGGVVPKQYIPAVEKGLREAMQKGVLAGYPVIDFKATLYDGSYHPVDSSEMAFKIAASLSFKKAMAEAKPILLEPIMKVEVIVPEENMGDVMGDLNSRRGRILGMEKHGRYEKISALVPLAEMYKYAIVLKSLTSGRGTYSMEFHEYEEVPPDIAKKIIEAASREEEK